MRKDRLVLLLLLTAFALLGADCRLISTDDDPKEKLPNRAAPASPLLRTYYDTLSTPSGMTANDKTWIPEDRDDLRKDGPLELKFDMGGGAVVTDVRLRLRVAGPLSGNGSSSEVQCRVRAPNGTRSGWKDVDFATEAAVDPQVEIVFLNEFDNLPTDGTWVVELQDSLDDGDGRCVFRNGTLRINLGEAAGLAGNQTETSTLGLGSPSYTYIPAMAGIRDLGDWGHFGFADPTGPLRASFVFTAAPFFVRSFVLRLSVVMNTGVTGEDDLYAILVAPSGGWLAFRLAAVNEVESDAVSGGRIVTYAFAADSANMFGESFVLRGEPSAGTWTLALWDVKGDGNIAWLSKDGVDVGPVPVPNSPATLQLQGVS